MKFVGGFLIAICIVDIIPMYMVMGNTQAMEFIYYADM
jgi:hypothetical protein